VVDATDLPLNVSREILQDSRDIKAIRDGNTRRVLGLLEDLAENDKENYAKFWSAFGAVLKEGLGEDFGNRERLSKLLRFASTHNDSAVQDIALADVISRLKTGQEQIFYITAESWQAARSSPHLEAFRARGVEVLLLTDRVDEWMLSYLREFDGKKLQSVASGDFDLAKLGDVPEGESQAETAEDDATDTQLVEQMKTSLGERVKNVRITKRLVDSAACLVSAEGDVSGHLERILREAGREVPTRRPILEINPSHPLVRQLKGQMQSDQVGSRFDDWASVLFDQALLDEGGRLEDPAGFVKRLNDLLLALALRP
jgi:molecular chaperone HtpG